MVDWSAVRDIAKDWQTLIAGVLAFSGAWATLSAVRRQIKHNENLELKRRRDEAYAARAVMPAALSELTQYASTCIRTLTRAINEPNEVARAAIMSGMPEAPKGLISTFKEAIRFADPAIQEQVALLLAFFQIHEARLIGLKAAPDPMREIAFGHSQAIIDSADLYVKTTYLFAWARGRYTDEIPRSDPNDIENALFLSTKEISYHKDVSTLIESRRRAISSS